MYNNNIFKTIRLEKELKSNNPSITCELPVFKITNKNQDGSIEGRGEINSIRQKLLAPVANNFKIESFI